MSTLTHSTLAPNSNSMAQNATIISDLHDEIARLQALSDPSIYSKYEHLQACSDRKDESILCLRSRCRDHELTLEENTQTIADLQKTFRLDSSCARFKLEQMEESKRNLKLQQLQANVETCNCASKLVHARCVMREMEIDLVHQQFKVEQARKRIAKDKADMEEQKRFAKELKQQIEKLTFQRDSFHETTMNLIATLDKANKQTSALQKRYQIQVEQFAQLEEEKNKIASLLQLEHESKAKLEEEKSKEIEQSLGTIDSVRARLEQETGRRLEAEKEAKKARIEATSLANQVDGYVKRIERLEAQVEAKASESQQQLCERLNAIQDEMKKLQQQKVVVVSPGKMSVDCESVDYRITPERLLAARARSKRGELAAIEEQEMEDAEAFADIHDDAEAGSPVKDSSDEEKVAESAAVSVRPSRKTKRKAAPVAKRKTPPRKAKQRKTRAKDVSSQEKLSVATRRSKRREVSAVEAEPQKSSVQEKSTRPKRKKKAAKKVLQDKKEDDESSDVEAEATAPVTNENSSEDNQDSELAEPKKAFDDEMPADESSPVLPKPSPKNPRADMENATLASNVDKPVEQTKPDKTKAKAKPGRKVSKAAQNKKRKLMGRKHKFVGPSSFNFKFIDKKSAPKLKANVKR